MSFSITGVNVVRVHASFMLCIYLNLIYHLVPVLPIL